VLENSCSIVDCLGVFVDLNSDGVEEFVLLSTNAGWAFERRGEKWEFIGSVTSPFPATHTWDEVREALVGNNYSAVTPKWKLLTIGGRQFRVEPDR